ncbi:hypothetical protein [Pantoea agglomerans]|uniref:hypothetical protein n=1 Tax=Enterobacter agglomerans TaxID=549 RepID=UPI003C7A42A9
MISLNFGRKTCPLTREEVAFIAESLTAAVSGMVGHISVMSKKAKPVMHRAKKQSRIFRSNPPQSDQVLTSCLGKRLDV